MTPKEKLIYLAGVVDCDGCITIKGNFQTVIDVAVRDKGLIDWLQEKFPSRTYRRNNQGREKLYGWIIGDIKVTSILEGLIPFLTIKRRQALVALALRYAKEANGYKNRGNRPEGLTTYYLACETLIRRLNAREPYPYALVKEVISAAATSNRAGSHFFKEWGMSCSELAESEPSELAEMTNRPSNGVNK